MTSVTFHNKKVLTYYHKGKSIDKFEYREYNNKTLCVTPCPVKYFNRQENKENLSSNKLIITFKKPYKGTSIYTMC